MHLHKPSRLADWALLLLTPAVMAHKVEVSGDIGGTSHIEPNDNPRAGTPSLTWFALTRKGGEVIPLEDCNCQLAVYSAPRTEGAAPIQELPLRAVSQEGYQNIPGADITFPQIGAYDLVLRGEPTTPDDFQPFELTFSVTVVEGQSSPNARAELTIPSPQSDTATALPQAANSERGELSPIWVPAAVLVLIVATALVLAQRFLKKRK